MSQKEGLTMNRVSISELGSRFVTTGAANLLAARSLNQIRTGDIMAAVALAPYSVAIKPPVGVFFVGQNLQVDRVGAKTNVAKVINFKACGYFTDQVLVNVPMGTRSLDRRRAATINLKLAVAGSRVRRASPEPTRRPLEKAFTANSYLGDISLKC
jgi:hypothetical protein